MRLLTIAFIFLCVLDLGAQVRDVSPMSPPDYSLATLRSWKCIEEPGDINKDGIDDLALIAFPHFEEFITVEDGDTLDANKPVLAIFFGKKDGELECWRQYDNVLPFSESRFFMINYQMSVNDKGALTFDLDYFSSAGSWESRSERYVFRYQDNDFFLIGEDEHSFMRNSGEGTDTSINYLTSRKQVVTFNEFDRNIKPREKWSRIPRKPLRRMGTWTLGD